MKAPILCVVGLACAWVANGALACGACVEDAVAATYDHAVVSQAAASRRVVVFLQVVGGAALDDDHAQRLAREAAALPGVVAGSVRASTFPAALSFALDAARLAPAEALARLRRREPTLDLRAVKTIGPASAAAVPGVSTGARRATRRSDAAPR